MRAKKADSGILRGPITRRDRRAVYGTLILLPIAVWLGLMEAYVAYGPVVEPLQEDDADSIVVLPNHETMLEPDGTAGRHIFEWLDTHKSGTQLFEVGGNQFDGDTAELTPQSVDRLSRLAVMLKAHPKVATAIVGYSAIEPNDALSQELSTKRAGRVREELIRFGVPSFRITAQGRGASNPIAENDTPAGRQKNERVAVVLSHADGSEG